MMSWSQVGFQDAASPVMEEFLFFHDFALVVLAFILGLVGYMMVIAVTNRSVVTGLLEGQTLEALWTALPALVLIQLAVPSLLLLYSLDEATDSQVTLKAVGHQWYWSYEYADFSSVSGEVAEFDAYMLPDGPSPSFRLLDTDNRTTLPWGCGVRVLVSSADVLHAWAVPSLGVKVDACPGRLNQVSFSSHRPGIFFGQCSEICGANHSFMPICIEMVTGGDFLAWVSALL
uniref:Cytochrome c oxidase subunit 2 n=1 Tax=Ikanecator primus TaxID=3115570 RepID=A0AAU7VFN2_9MAXI